MEQGREEGVGVQEPRIHYTPLSAREPLGDKNGPSWFPSDFAWKSGPERTPPKKQRGEVLAFLS
jgi:hypothetical protein